MRDDHELVETLSGLAHELADLARAETLKAFRRPSLEIASKGTGGFDPVTEADRAAEAVMRARIEMRRPRDSILGEEAGLTEGDSGLTWVLDPIDGTRAYLAGAPTWGTLIAVADAAGPFLGIIDQPHVGERFSGRPGAAWLDGPRGRQPLAVRRGRTLAEAILLTTFPEIGTEAERHAFAAVSARARLTRYGLDCYAYALLAAGHVDLVIEAGLAPYDIAAPIAVIEAAGGRVTAWDGGPAAAGGRVLAAGDADLHAQVAEILQSGLSG